MDRFRQVYNILTPEQTRLVARIKEKAAELEDLYSEVTDLQSSGEAKRLIALSLTDLENSVMWIAKAAMTQLT